MHVEVSAPQRRHRQDRCGALGREFGVETEPHLHALDPIVNGEDNNNRSVCVS